MNCGFSFSASVFKLTLLSLTNAPLVPILVPYSHLSTVDAFQWLFRFLNCLPSRHSLAVPLSLTFPLAPRLHALWFSVISTFTTSFFFSHKFFTILISL